jgi:hypothetical protein
MVAINSMKKDYEGNVTIVELPGATHADDNF